MTKDSKFTCPGCKETFSKLDSHADAFTEELKRRKGSNNIVLLCEDCSHEFVEWKKKQKIGLN